MKAAFTGKVSKAGIKKELGFYPKDIEELEDGSFEVVGPKGVSISLVPSDDEDKYDVVNTVSDDEDDIEDLDLEGTDELDLDLDLEGADELDLDLEDVKEPEKKAPKKETKPKPAKKPANKATTFSEEIINKLANGSIVNAKRIVKTVKAEEVAKTITAIQGTKLDAIVDFKGATNEIIITGEQAGLAAIYLLLNEDK